MRSLFLLGAVAVLLSLTGVASAALDFNMWTLVGHNSSGAVDPGSSIDLLVQFDTNENIGAVTMEVLLPMEGWTRNWFELSDYGWYEDDSNTWDHSTPAGSTVPVVINNGSWPATASAPDFYFDTSLNPLGTTTTGNDVNFASFRLTIPVGTTPDLYNIGIRHATYMDGDFNQFDAADANFSLQVNGQGTPDVPEPTTLALSLVGFAGMALLRRRRA
jgi:hypothetical protein